MKVNRKAYAYADELFKLSSKAVKRSSVKIQFSFYEGKEILCRVVIDEDDIYEIPVDQSFTRNAEINYEACKQRLTSL